MKRGLNWSPSSEGLESPFGSRGEYLALIQDHKKGFYKRVNDIFSTRMEIVQGIDYGSLGKTRGF